MDIIVLMLSVVCIYMYKMYLLGSFSALQTVHATKDSREIGYNLELVEKQNAFTYYVNSIERLNNG